MDTIRINAIILALAILPVIALMIYVYKSDKYDKEPIGMLIKELLLGVV